MRLFVLSKEPVSDKQQNIIFIYFFTGTLFDSTQQLPKDMGTLLNEYSAFDIIDQKLKDAKGLRFA
jgi:hypothetical protein